MLRRTSLAGLPPHRLNRSTARLPDEHPISNRLRAVLTPTPNPLAISMGLFFGILTTEVCGLFFALRLPGDDTHLRTSSPAIHFALFSPAKFLGLLFVHPRSRSSGSRPLQRPLGIYDHIVSFGRAAGEVSDHFRPAPFQHLSLTYREASVDNRQPLVSSFEPQLWFTALPSPTTAGF